MLSNIVDKEALAAALGVTFNKQIVYYLYRMPETARYKPFSIKKRSGGLRAIAAPRHGLKIIQRRLAVLLSQGYGHRSGVHGYITGRSISTNASAHVRQTFVLNLDLEDFFGAINFGRVRGILMSRIYGANEEVATLIAQLCCHGNSLPQGAPTSPIISNIVCGALDADLKQLGRKYRCVVTRYSDDITISCATRAFPAPLATSDSVDGKRVVTIGAELEETVRKHGFKINARKTRLLTKSDRQEVTGLVVNRFVNVPRTYIRNIWAALHAWRKFGLEAVAARFKEKYDCRTRDNADFESVIFGRIQHIGSIRGFEDEIYLKLRRAFNQLSSKQIPPHATTWEHSIDQAVWIIEHLYDDAKSGQVVCGQGTIFHLQGMGWITCAHCLGPEGNVIYNPAKPSARYQVAVHAKNDDIDLAVVIPTETTFPDIQGLVASSDSEFVERLDRISLVGWPQYGPGNTLSVKEGHIQSIKRHSGIRRFNVSTPIIQGNSGGPVFNNRHQVIGVAATGAKAASDEGLVEAHGVIPIAALQHLPTITSAQS